MKRRALDVLGIAGLLLFILSFAIAFTINFTPLYSWTAQSMGLAESLGMPHETLMENYHILLDYLNNPWIPELHMPDFPSSESGLFHFYEVKRLFLLDYVILALTAVGSFFYLRYLRRTNRIWVLVKPFMVASMVPVALLFFLAVNFDRLFVLFHEVFFNNDAWIFNPSTDPIILALPQDFFMYCFILTFVLMEAMLIGGYFLTKKYAFRK